MENKIILIGCSIFNKEIHWLVQKNNWPVKTVFLNSALHSSFEHLSNTLTKTLEKYKAYEPIVFYGVCHPLMDQILERYGSTRTACQNCIDILVGQETFMRELSNGAYFLLEEWAKNWEDVNLKIFGNKLSVLQEIFQSSHKYMLAIRTPCSGDFTADAQKASQISGLPLRWMDEPLDHLEKTLLELIQNKMEKIA